MIQANKSSEYLIWADALRVLATVAVVVIHVSANVVFAIGKINPFEWWVGNILDSASRWCVPMFVMISGALLLDPSKNEEISIFFGKRIKRIIIPLIFWSFTYFLWLKIRGQEITLRYMVRNLLTGGTYYHLYFLYLIFGLYLITPVLKTYLQFASSRNITYFVIICFLFVIVQQFVNFIESREMFSSLALTRFIPFIGYYIAGFHLRKFVIQRKHLKSILVVLFLCIFFISFGSWLLMKKYGITSRGYYLHNYLSPPEIIMSFCIFFLAIMTYGNGGDTSAVFRKINSKFQRLAPATFGVYLVHPIALDLLSEYGINGLWKTSIVGIPLTTILTLIACFTVINFMRKVPLLRLTV